MKDLEAIPERSMDECGDAGPVARAATGRAQDIADTLRAAAEQRARWLNPGLQDGATPVIRDEAADALAALAQIVATMMELGRWA